ncbi:MAG: Gfo/Idh/MocA family oxidoreductase [Chloroflexales bacterium]|nr:Gfo/Idh/MocA family oxidoreductase [Chloroflexales bacterium]
MPRIRIAQYGTKHGHAAGKLLALRTNPRVELAGVFEPDPARRRALAQNDDAYRDVRWFDDAGALLGDATIAAVAAEGRNDESLAHAEQIVAAGKHLWYDKPAGDDWARWRRVAQLAQTRSLLVQMGYMFRYHAGFGQIARWVRAGLLGDVFAVRAHMSTWIGPEQRQSIARHRGGILYDLGGHMFDQIVWLLGRPQRASAFLRHDGDTAQGFHDNTLAVLEYPHALATVDIAALETPPPARRFEVYGICGSAILEPFEPATALRLCLDAARDGYAQGEQRIPVQPQARQELYALELDAFLATITGERAPDRTPAHELLVQETLLRATGGIAEGQEIP